MMGDWSDEQKAALAAAPTIKLNPNPDGSKMDVAAAEKRGRDRNNTQLAKDAGGKNG